MLDYARSMTTLRLSKFSSYSSAAWCWRLPTSQRNVRYSCRTSAWSSPTLASWWPSSWWRASSMLPSTSGDADLVMVTVTMSTSTTTPRDLQVGIYLVPRISCNMKGLQSPQCWPIYWTTSPSMKRTRSEPDLSVIHLDLKWYWEYLKCNKTSEISAIIFQ